MKLLIYLCTLFFSQYSFSGENKYTIKVTYRATNEVKTYELKNDFEDFKIPVDSMNMNCILSRKNPIYSNKHGGATVTCLRPDSGVAFSSYLNCSDRDATSVALWHEVKLERKFIKKNKLSIPEGLRDHKDNTLVNSASIFIVCNALIL